MFEENCLFVAAKSFGQWHHKISTFLLPGCLGYRDYFQLTRSCKLNNLNISQKQEFLHTEDNKTIANISKYKTN